MVAKSGNAKTKRLDAPAPAVVTAADMTNDPSCTSSAAAHPGLASSVVPELRKLAEYEQLCGGAIASKLSIFVTTPTTAAQAKASAREVAAMLKAFAATGVAPLVFMEPTDPDGAQIDLTQYASGAYDASLEAYYGALRTAGVSDGEMGTWVFVPEGNLPLWSTVDPNVYAQVVTKTATAMKRQFPQAQAAVMLDSKSYKAGETWGQGSYVSLLPYVRSLPRGLIDSFGIQGFPWVAPANEAPSRLYDPNVFLRADLATEAARALGITSIWFNTGTFKQMYAGQPARAMTMSPADRRAMLRGIVQQAARVKAEGFTVAIHIFAENKAATAEGTDWSYWASLNDAGSDKALFSAFAADATSAGLGIWLYDSAGR